MSGTRGAGYAISGSAHASVIALMTALWVAQKAVEALGAAAEERVTAVEVCVAGRWVRTAAGRAAAEVCTATG